MPTPDPQTLTETMEELHPPDQPSNVSLPVFSAKPRRGRPRKNPPTTEEPPPFLVDDEATGEQVLTTGRTLRGGRVVGSSPAATPTEASSGGTTDPVERRKQARNTSKLVKGLLKIVIVSAEALLGRMGREFRRPEEHQIDGVAQPLARIAVRHLDLSYISDDLLDLTEAGGGLSDYILEGPVAPRRNYVEHVGFPIDPEAPAPVVNTSNPGNPQREAPPEPWLLAEPPAARPGVEKPIIDPNARVTYKS